MSQKKLYRINADFTKSYFSEAPICRLVCESYEITKETPKGFWLEDYSERGRWVSKTGRKRFAYPTKKEALESFRFRKYRQVRILKRQLSEALAAQEEALKDDPNFQIEEIPYRF